MSKVFNFIGFALQNISVHHFKHFVALMYGMIDLDFLLFNKQRNEKYETYLMKMKTTSSSSKNNKQSILHEYYPTIKAPTAPVRILLKKLDLWYGHDELNSFDNFGYQNADELYGDLNGFYLFYSQQRYMKCL